VADTATSNLTVTTISLTMADLGPLNPLPVVAAELDQPYTVGEGVPEELQASARYGVVPNVYPYLMQDGYSREAAPKELPAVVLENSKLRVTVLPSLGGRIWELFDKATGKQLLHTHDAPQLANIALRKAWFAGGLEWNIGTRGHSPTSCDPLHAAIVHTPDGKHILRMWEFERLREVVFQVDIWLPADSPVVFAAVRIRNPNDHDVPMYWWSNAAIPETDRTRVIAPANEAFGSDYTTDITRVRPTSTKAMTAPGRSTARTQLTSSSTLTPPSGAGWWLRTTTAMGWRCCPRDSCGERSCSCGVKDRAASAGRSGSAPERVPTLRSKRAWRRHSLSTW
jgi:hypothetical protein